MGARVTQGAWVGEVTDREAWNGFVERAPISTVMHRWEWREIIETTYGHQSIYLGAFRGSELTGVLPLVSMTRPLSGTRLVSMPFGEGGGPCATDDDVARSLVGEARDRAARAKAVLDLRTTQDLGLDMPVSLDKVAMVLELGDSAEALWGRLPAERRNRVKKAGREGLTATVDGLEALDDFYGVFARNMRDLGSPVPARGFFEQILVKLADRTRLVVLRAHGRPVGAAMMLRQGDTVTVPWISSLREFFPKCPNQLLYWRAMEQSIADGAVRFDFGRSSIGAGTLEAKRRWGATPVQQYWYYHPEAAGSSAENASRFGWAMRAWRRLPLAAANVLGPRLRGWISN